MPRTELIPDVLYDGNFPYHYEYDNLPIKNILEKINIINNAVDVNSQILRDAAGNQGSLSNRLDQSIEFDGNLKEEAINQTLHNIGAHSDGVYDDGNGPIDFVRMKKAESDKLATISSNASAIQIQFDIISNTVLFKDELVEFENSDEISWELTAPNKIKPRLNLTTTPHQHFYDLIPVHSNLSTPDYINYKVNSISSSFTEGSLRVYINGIRITDQGILVPDGSNVELMISTSFTADFENGTFSLNRALSTDDVIRIDFDINF